jgi:hypothetical protein
MAKFIQLIHIRAVVANTWKSIPFRSFASVKYDGNGRRKNDVRRDEKTSSTDPSFNLFKVLSEDDGAGVGKSGKGAGKPVLTKNFLPASSSSDDDDEMETQGDEKGKKSQSKRSWSEKKGSSDKSRRSKKGVDVEINETSLLVDQDGEAISIDEEYENETKNKRVLKGECV